VFTLGISDWEDEACDLKHPLNALPTVRNWTAVVKKIAQAVYGDD
jgi:hypothetical protein